MKVKIVGRWENGKPAPCNACLELKRLTRISLDELGLRDVDIEECASEAEYNSLGVMAMPVLIINGKIKMSGRVPPVEMLKELLRFEQGKETVR